MRQHWSEKHPYLARGTGTGVLKGSHQDPIYGCSAVVARLPWEQEVDGFEPLHPYLRSRAVRSARSFHMAEVTGSNPVSASFEHQTSEAGRGGL